MKYKGAKKEEREEERKRRMKWSKIVWQQVSTSCVGEKAIVDGRMTTALWNRGQRKKGIDRYK